ncbi:NepR family anti-sigma factor [Sphingomonas sp.]
MNSRAKNKTLPDSPEVGRALRSVYDDTLNEKIPPDLLDLLGKLG